MLLLAGLTTGNKIVVAVVAILFILFALASAFLAPKRWPDFPGKQGMSVYVIASLVMFAAMITTIIVFAKEAPEAEAGGAPEGQAANTQQIDVNESEWKIQLPATGTLKEGTYTFVVKNTGQVPHDLAIQGMTEKTPLIKPGGTAKLRVDLRTGSYTLYCSVTGHKALGMVAKLSVG